MEHLDVVTEDLVRVLVQVGHGDTRRQLGEVRVLRALVRCRLGSELVQLRCGYAGVHAGHDLLGDLDSVDVVRVEPIAELGNARRNLVELDVLATTVALDDVHRCWSVCALEGGLKTGRTRWVVKIWSKGPFWTKICDLE
ncbi:hypothetical protein, variant [Phytophthora nicotianae P1976]|uniref:Uncharacterized protein n=1 Tax=Phytophthora nicotianae P1976 TaxID=1317066 RepID=A0A080ZHH2_PHYNI|nr:hypothetical protein, variant [Phytophthora nicotianae P1976]